MYIVETAYGKVRGAEIADGVLSWRGIPYAAPPVGELRLRPPSPPQAWSGIRDALAYGDRAPQPEPLPEPDAPPMAEDCLYLNVTAPAGASGRPVLFWIHGGGYEMGHGPDQAGDGAAFARSHGLVVVTFNYRLGALGFLDAPGERPTGAFGLHDQVAALRWTRENIAAFGGDPSQITIYGLSAGGKSVTNLLASPLAAGMIARAAESSGGDHIKSPEQAAALTERFLRELGTTAGRLRAVPAADILAAQAAIASPPRSTWIWRPSVDGVALTAHPLTAIAGGAAARVPLLLQTCARETALYQLLGPDAAEQTEGVLDGYFGAGKAAAMLASYAAAYPDLDATALRVVIMSDERYMARTEMLADAQAAHGPVWRSRYDGPYFGLDDDPRFAKFAPVLVGAHGGDGAGIWLGGEGVAGPLHEAWGAFVTAGDPGWPGYNAATGRTAMIFDAVPDGPRLAADPFAHVRATWLDLSWQPGTWWPALGLA
ncbi:carboxylesterase/lipase family protein [Trebonia kvetii]|uniref:Carboxylic ester hydrolase n=1 Tax=Trebonia kvetii TaxID=2480626 RepID=A0A6P2C1B9_9ACTN|nr:carboxylesterase family protein [Trebonia kvetii]TVZ05182.1 carboxylesterase/lipase family protein [Trebonia kvetii]